MDIFQNFTMTLAQSNGTPIKTHLAAQLDNTDIPWNMDTNDWIPNDTYDLYSIGWTSPVPVRGNYFIDEATDTKYSVFGNPAIYTDHIEVRITKYSGPN